MNIGFSILGFNPDQLNGTMIPTYLDHIPEGTSTRPFVHYAQALGNCSFCLPQKLLDRFTYQRVQYTFTAFAKPTAAVHHHPALHERQV